MEWLGLVILFVSFVLIFIAGFAAGHEVARARVARFYRRLLEGER